MRNNRTKQLILCAMFVALIAIGAFITIPIPIIPLTLQDLFVMLAGILLGPKWGALASLIYVFMGLAGLPVFTQGGGLAYVLKPSFGFLIGLLCSFGRRIRTLFFGFLSTAGGKCTKHSRYQKHADSLLKISAF